MNIVKKIILKEVDSLRFFNLIHKNGIYTLSHRSFGFSPYLKVASIRNTKKKIIKPVTFKPKKTVIELHDSMTIKELAIVCERTVDQVYESLQYIKINNEVLNEDKVLKNLDDVKKIVQKFGYRWKLHEKKLDIVYDGKDAVRQPPADKSILISRPPVVTIMGHVDHGKTTLLDSLRHSHIVDQEFGGITQHIGAFTILTPNNETITFLDTPGHAAFSAMRARGANVTDIVILVVAADDGVMEQTIQSITFAKQANVPIIVAINKMDKPGANAENIMQQLLKYDIQVETLGGEIQCIPISALNGDGFTELLEAIQAQAEILQLKSDVNGLVEGNIIESKTHPGRGKLSTALIQRGTLKRGNILVSGLAWCKVRGMFNDKGETINTAKPGYAIEIIGWRELPHAGDLLLEVENEKRAHEVINFRTNLKKDEKLQNDALKISQKIEEHRLEYHEKLKEKRLEGKRLGAIYKKINRKESIETYVGPKLSIIVKGDVDGSVEAILDALDSYKSEQCQLDILHYGVGSITDHDIDLASSFNGIIYGFNVDCIGSAHSSALLKKVEIQIFNVIYKLLHNMHDNISKRLPLINEEEIIGRANVLQLFKINQGKHKIPVAGCRCIHGHLQKKYNFRLIRNGNNLIDGPIDSLKHFKNEVETIKTDVECGIHFNDISIEPQSGDEIVCYKINQVKQKLKWTLNF